MQLFKRHVMRIIKFSFCLHKKMKIHEKNQRRICNHCSTPIQQYCYITINHPINKCSKQKKEHRGLRRDLNRGHPIFSALISRAYPLLPHDRAQSQIDEKTPVIIWPIKEVYCLFISLSLSWSLAAFSRGLPFSRDLANAVWRPDVFTFPLQPHSDKRS